MTTNGRTFNSLVRLIPAMVLVVNYGFIVPKLQHREVSSWFMSVSFCTEKCHMSQFAGRGVDEQPMFGDDMDTSCMLTLCSSP